MGNCKDMSDSQCHSPAVVAFAWGSRLPAELQRPFDIIICNDLLYEVYTRRLDAQFSATLRELVAYQRQACTGDQSHSAQLLFCFQARASPQENRILSDLCSRL